MSMPPAAVTSLGQRGPTDPGTTTYRVGWDVSPLSILTVPFLVQSLEGKPSFQLLR